MHKTVNGNVPHRGHLQQLELTALDWENNSSTNNKTTQTVGGSSLEPMESDDVVYLTPAPTRTLLVVVGGECCELAYEHRGTLSTQQP